MRARVRGDRGSALIVVIGIGAAVALMAVTMVSVATFASATSSKGRAQVQAQATAEAALDSTLSQLRSSAARGAETTFPCTFSQSSTTPSGKATTTIAVKYGSASMPALACPMPSSATITTAEMVATTNLSFFTGNGKGTVKRVVKQRMTVADVGATTSLFPYGVFSGENLTTTNGFRVDGGAGVFTNGAFNCSVASSIYGNVTSVGSAYLTNTCVTGAVKTGGTFKCDSSPTIQGDVEAAGLGTSQLSNTCSVLGSVTAGGPITIGNSAKIGANLISSTSSILASGGAVRVAGYGRAGTTIKRDDSGSLPVVFASGTSPNNPSAVPVAPTVVKMPTVYYTDLTPTGSSVLDYKTWLYNNALANGAPSWTDQMKKTTCTADNSSYALNGNLVTPAVPTVIDARGCAVNFWGGNGNLTINLKSDLIIVGDSFTIGNLYVKSSNPSAKISFIVPLPAGAQSCNGVGTGNVSFNNTLKIDPNVQTFIYTNGTATLTNNSTFSGSVYGCKTSFSVDTHITYTDMTPPNMGTPASPYYAFTPGARYNLP